MESNEETARMRKEYVTPADADVLWADAIVFLLPPDLGPSSEECAAYVGLLRQLKSEGKLEGKLGATDAPVRLRDTEEATSYGRKTGQLP